MSSNNKTAQKPVNLIRDLFNKRLEGNKKLSDDYAKFVDYINPFVSQNKQMLELMDNIQFYINIGLPADDLILSSSMMANHLAWEMARPKMPSKIKCTKCGEIVLDMTELEKEFEQNTKRE